MTQKEDKKTVNKNLESEIDNEAKAQASVNQQNYLTTKRFSRLFLYQVFGITFLVIALLMIVCFFIIKYLNFYFNFGPINNSADAEKYKNANGLIPFDKGNGSFYHDFQNEIVTSGGKDVVIVANLVGANTPMAVTRSAFIVNSIANGNLYIGLPLTFIIGAILLIIHYTVAKPKVKSMAAAWFNAQEQNDKDNSKKKPKTKVATAKKPKKVNKNKNKKTKK